MRRRRRPETYHEWRSLWHSVLFSIGLRSTLRHNCLLDPNGLQYADICPDWHKVDWKLHEQARRIHLRMEVEQEAKTESWNRALLESIFDEDDEE
jgi:hypothetical protein